MEAVLAELAWMAVARGGHKGAEKAKATVVAKATEMEAVKEWGTVVATVGWMVAARD